MTSYTGIMRATSQKLQETIRRKKRRVEEKRSGEKKDRIRADEGKRKRRRGEEKGKGCYAC